MTPVRDKRNSPGASIAIWLGWIAAFTAVLGLYAWSWTWVL